jgi:hypothetical protein
VIPSSLAAAYTTRWEHKRLPRPNLTRSPPAVAVHADLNCAAWRSGLDVAAACGVTCALSARTAHRIALRTVLAFVKSTQEREDGVRPVRIESQADLSTVASVFTAARGCARP